MTWETYGELAERVLDEADDERAGAEAVEALDDVAAGARAADERSLARVEAIRCCVETFAPIDLRQLRQMIADLGTDLRQVTGRSTEVDERVTYMRLIAARAAVMGYWSRRPFAIRGESNLFPGPVVDGGRREWDWNPNGREAREQRWYAGFDLDSTLDFTKPLPDNLCVGGRWTW